MRMYLLVSKGLGKDLDDLKQKKKKEHKNVKLLVLTNIDNSSKGKYMKRLNIAINW